MGTFELGTDGPRVIVVGVDGSRTSLRAAAYAGGLARRQGSRLVVVYVAAPSLLASLAPGAAAVMRNTLDEIAEDIQKRVDAAAKEQGIDMTFVTARGNPSTEITRVADEIQADAVVVGASEAAGHRFGGSLAGRLMRSGRWPVTVVP